MMMVMMMIMMMIPNLPARTLARQGRALLN
jgi:hypothetical protein